jgi:hypothetical protein
MPKNLNNLIEEEEESEEEESEVEVSVIKGAPPVRNRSRLPVNRWSSIFFCVQELT